VDQARDVGRVVREVAVHLEDEVGSVRERPLKARKVRRPESLLALTVEDRDEVELGGEPVCDFTRAVGGIVVDDEHVDVVCGESAQHRLEVLALVVRRQADGRVTHAGAGYGTHKIVAVTTLPRNADVADQFDLLADLLELEGAESFRVLAYHRAATRMRETSGPIAQLALDGRGEELQGVGKTIRGKIVQTGGR